MKPVFADTSFYQALLNPRDSWHITAVQYASSYFGPVITSEYVLIELGAVMSRSHLRKTFLLLFDQLSADERTEIVPSSSALFEDAVQFFRSRLDKQWSLADCSSFVIMKDRGLSLALTTDRHFEQAGFRSELR